MKGWVYVISTKTHRLLKVGYTDRDPEVRAKELNDTSSPHPHVVQYAVLVIDARELERKVHSALHKYKEAKEWFDCDLVTAVSAIRSSANQKILHEDCAFELIEKARIFEQEEKLKRAEEKARVLQLQNQIREEEQARQRQNQILEKEQAQLRVAIQAQQAQRVRHTQQAPPAPQSPQDKREGVGCLLGVLTFLILSTLLWPAFTKHGIPNADVVAFIVGLVVGYGVFIPFKRK